MKISLDLPELIAAELLIKAKEDGHNNRSAVIRKAITFYLSQKSHKVACKKEQTATKQTASA